VAGRPLRRAAYVVLRRQGRVPLAEPMRGLQRALGKFARTRLRGAEFRRVPDSGDAVRRGRQAAPLGRHRLCSYFYAFYRDSRAVSRASTAAVAVSGVSSYLPSLRGLLLHLLERQPPVRSRVVERVCLFALRFGGILEVARGTVERAMREPRAGLRLSAA